MSGFPTCFSEFILSKLALCRIRLTDEADEQRDRQADSGKEEVTQAGKEIALLACFIPLHDVCLCLHCCLSVYMSVCHVQCLVLFIIH